MSAEGTVLHLNVAPYLFPSKTPLKKTTLETNNGIVTIASANIGLIFMRSCGGAEAKNVGYFTFSAPPRLRMRNDPICCRFYKHQ